MKIDFHQTSQSIGRILENPTNIQKTAKELKDISDIYVLGRGIHYPIAIEASRAQGINIHSC